MRLLRKRPEQNEMCVTVSYSGYSILGLDHRTMRMLDLALCYLKDADNEVTFIEPPNKEKINELHQKLLNAIS